MLGNQENLSGGFLMVDESKNAVFMKEFQSRFDKKLREQEMSVLEHWQLQLDRLTSMKPEGIASLQLQIKRISDMMENRIKILKRE
jgi:hypothetical protein